MELTFYLLAVGLGFSWLGTAPPTAGVVGKLFGMRYLATLYGMTMVSHQVGGFFGAWLGGLAFSQYGNYLWMWYADALFAACRGAVQFADSRAAGGARGRVGLESNRPK